MVVIQNGNIVSHGGDIHISDNGNSESRAQLVIKVPCGNKISVDGVIGNVNIDKLSCDLEADISGSGKIEISSGCINKLRADVSGCGDVKIMATAKTAKLSVSGVGNIHVKHVLNRPKESRSGMGNIRIDSVG